MPKPAAALAVLLVAVAAAFAANRHVQGAAHLVTIDLGGGSAPITSLVLSEEVAGALYEGMSGVPTMSYRNRCEGKTVQVEKRSGASFACEKWPDVCYPKTYYKCEASFDLVTGKASAQ